MISQTAEYALRAMVFLCDHEGESHTADKISAHTKVPVGYLSKIMQQLVRAGLVSSRRGPYGGFTTALPADELNVLNVIDAVDPLKRLDGCPLHLKSHGNRLCPLHRLLDNAIAYIQRTFDKVTMADLLKQNMTDEGGSHPLCEFPRHQAEDKPVRRNSGPAKA
jgi:Rrf2 family protein